MEKVGLIIFVVISAICVVKGIQYLWAIATYDYDILDTQKDAVADVRCNGGLDAMLEVVKSIRKSDCGAWLKDCNGIHRCSDGREKRQDLSRLLDKLYKAASI